ncbi:MAG: pyridoxamine 5'-phosphate oxidase family protein [Pseudomonadales bacterium]|nr:pyridoxamine 5'-phosphate oxidase family protein [Halioglobus sp.]MCP5131816.1 pyridoxamine 5'-phosphate oxidase family protein [Pseudomonadales bacterium]
MQTQTAQASINGPWSAKEIAQFLQDTCYPMRLACVGADGYPRVVSVWFLYERGQLFCASHSSSQLVALLGGDGRIGFEVATNDPPYFGVRGQGDAALTTSGGDRMLERLLERYLGRLDSPLAKWLLSRKAEEVLITLTPRRLFSWDYRQRMGSTVETS